MFMEDRKANEGITLKKIAGHFLTNIYIHIYSPTHVSHSSSALSSQEFLGD